MSVPSVEFDGCHVVRVVAERVRKARLIFAVGGYGASYIEMSYDSSSESVSAQPEEKCDSVSS